MEDKVSYIFADATSLPIEPESFSKVWTMNMFYHIQDKERAMQEMYRVLECDGKLAFDDWTITNKITLREKSLLKHDWVSSDWITDEKLLALIEGCGFVVEEIEDFSQVYEIMQKCFKKTFNRTFRKKIILMDTKWGESMCQNFITAVERTINLYSEGKMKYLQIIARK